MSKLLLLSAALIFASPLALSEESAEEAEEEAQST